MNKHRGSMCSNLRPLFAAVALTATICAQGTVAVSVDFQVLTSGPVHESFARPIVFGAVDAHYVSVDPPALIDEITPLDRPVGYSEWIPGYWNYDDQRQSWTWVTGTWRVPPAGLTWVTGYWNRDPRGWRYVSGYWASSSIAGTEIEYLPAPPPLASVDPIGNATTADSIWVPGNWAWGGSAYQWRQGYWMQPRADYVWMPADYIWTPSGYVYQESHWDFFPDRRGLLFAPIAFGPRATIASGFAYTPEYVVNAGSFNDNILFARPLDHHYYYGDYYAQSHWNSGVYPSFAFHMTRYGYDPLFAHANWRYGRENPQWFDQQRTLFTTRRSDESARPARTLEEQGRRPAGAENVVIVLPVRDAATKATKLNIERAPESARADFVTRAKERQQAGAERATLEKAPGGNADANTARKIKAPKTLFPRSEEAAKSGVTMPDRPNIPKAEANAQPKPGAEGARLPDPSVDRRIGQPAGRGDKDAPKTDDPNQPRRRTDDAPDAKPNPAPADDRPLAPPAPPGGNPDRRPAGNPEPAAKPVPGDRPLAPPAPPGGNPERRPAGSPDPAPKPAPGDKPLAPPAPPGGNPERRPAGSPDARPKPAPRGDKPIAPPAPPGGNPERRPAPGPDAKPQPKPDGKPAPAPAPNPAPAPPPGTPPPNDPKPE